MLSFFFLVSRVLSAESFSIKYENEYGRTNAFDLICTKDGIEYDTSSSGWAIAYQFYNNDTPGNKRDIQRNDNGVHKDGDITISLTSKEEPGPGFLTLQFEIRNTGNEAKTLNLSVLNDAVFATTENREDNCELAVLDNGNALCLYDNKKGVAYTLLPRSFGDFNDVDALYYGHYFDDDAPFFKDGTGRTTPSNPDFDEIFSFSWLNRKVEPKSSLVLKTVIGAGRITRPVVSFTSTFADKYTMNQEIEFTFEVTNIVADQKISYYIESTNNQIIKDEFIATTTSKKITQKVTVRSSPEFNITIYCKRGNYEVSIPITKILNVPRSPSLHFDEKPENSYTKNSRIAVKGRIIDVSTGLLAYKFDSTETKVLPKEYTVSNSYYFSELIDFPVNFQDGQHCITFYAVDKASNTYSKGDEFGFSFVNTHPPEIQNLKTSAETVIRGRTVKVMGQIKDEDPNSYSDISLIFGSETTIISNFETKNTWTVFEYELTIPPDTPPGKYRISVSAKDTGRDQSEDYYCYVTVLIQPITPFQTAPKTAFETPFNTAFQTAHNTPYETPFSTAFQTAHKTAFETPFNTAFETPFSTAFQTAHNTAFETPFSTAFQTAHNTPYETPFSSAFQTAHDTPFVTVFETPFSTAQETPIKEVPPANGEPQNEKSNLDNDSKNSSSVTPNSADDIPPLFQDDGSTKKKKNTILIVVICSVIAVIIIAILIAVFIYRRTHQDDSEEESSIEMAETVIQSVVNPNDGVTLDNPLFTTTTVDDDEDIFAGDFEEGNTVHYFFIKEEDE